MKHALANSFLFDGLPETVDFDESECSWVVDDETLHRMSRGEQVVAGRGHLVHVDESNDYVNDILNAQSRLDELQKVPSIMMVSPDVRDKIVQDDRIAPYVFGQAQGVPKFFGMDIHASNAVPPGSVFLVEEAKVNYPITPPPLGSSWDKNWGRQHASVVPDQHHAYEVDRFQDMVRKGLIDRDGNPIPAVPAQRKTEVDRLRERVESVQEVGRLALAS